MDGVRRTSASIAQLAEHALRKRMVVGSIPTGGYWPVVGPPGAQMRLAPGRARGGGNDAKRL